MLTWHTVLTGAGQFEVEKAHMCALQEADVILVSADSAPPVCRLIAIDKYKYEQAKVERDAKRKQRESR